ncbi:MAG: glycine cleavage system protein GcvH [Methylovulum sp.]|nr:glycine cleavage system protein GcvH [Methylovulum sp.]
MRDLPEQLKYAASHEWVQQEDNNILRVGITDFAQQALGDLMYIQLPELGRQVAAQEQCATVESVKTASDLFSPVSGTIIAVNEALMDQPEQVNDTPYESWLFCVKADDLSELDSLMDADGYLAMIGQ